MSQEKPNRLPSLCTEAEARTSKMCPFTAGRDMPRHCVASSCGAWDWVTSQFRPNEETGRCGLVNFQGGPFPAALSEPTTDLTPYRFLTGGKAQPSRKSTAPEDVI